MHLAQARHQAVHVGSPPLVAFAGDVPVAAIVGQDDAVFLHCRQDDQRRTGERTSGKRRLQAQAQSHRG